MVKFLRHLLPMLSPSFHLPANDKVITMVSGNLDRYLPFRQHATSFANAWQEIYADLDRLASDDGIGFFNILAFRGVFFGSPFAKSNRYRWFNSLDDWELFKANEHKDEEYYVMKNCYGQSQKLRDLSLLRLYWDRRLLWNDLFNKPEKPTVTQVFKWLTSRPMDDRTKKLTTLFKNIGDLTALLICGDIVEAGILPVPSASEWPSVYTRQERGQKLEWRHAAW